MPRHIPPQNHDYSENLTKDSRALCDAAKVIVAESKQAIAYSRRLRARVAEQAKRNTR